MDDILLVCGAVIPAIVLCVYVYRKDRAEKEPLSMLLVLLGIGAFMTVPACGIEKLLGSFIDAPFSALGSIENEKIILSAGTYRLYQIASNFIGVALVEEGLKFLALMIFTRKSKEFNSLFDGMIYSIFVSLGFAAFENIMYAFNYGWHTVIMRAVISVPGHMFFAVIMGFYYSKWHLNETLRKLVREAFELGRIYRIKGNYRNTSRRLLISTLVFPVLAHGFFDYCLSMDSTGYLIAFYIFLAIMYINCFKSIKKLSAMDELEGGMAVRSLYREYPEMYETAGR